MVTPLVGSVGRDTATAGVPCSAGTWEAAGPVPLGTPAGCAPGSSALRAAPPGWLPRRAEGVWAGTPWALSPSLFSRDPPPPPPAWSCPLSHSYLESQRKYLDRSLCSHSPQAVMGYSPLPSPAPAWLPLPLHLHGGWALCLRPPPPVSGDP